MCGIVGIISGAGATDYVRRRDWMVSALTAGAVRGHHATGIYAVPRRTKKDKYIYTYKKAVPGGAFVMDDDAEAILWTMDEYAYVVGHNRLATQGGLGDAQAHPFMVDNVILVHNGTIHESNGLPNFVNYAVDSEWIASLLDKKPDEEVFSQLKGAFALVWYDYGKKQLKIARNKERPLHYAKHDLGALQEDTYFFASEPEMLKWLCLRHAFKIGEIKEFETEKLYTFTEGKGKTMNMEVTDLPFWKPPVSKPATTHWGNQSYYDRSSARSRTYTSSAAVPIKPKIVVSGRAREILSGLSVGLGDSVEFVINNVVLPEPKSRHGMMFGTQIGGDNLPVMCVGFDVRRNDDMQTFKGRVYGVDTSVDEVCLVVAKPEPTNNSCPYARMFCEVGIPPTPSDITSNKSSTKQESPRKAEVPAVEMATLDRADTPWGPGWRTVRGPGGQMIELSHFDQLTQHGCANCGCYVSFKIADELIWTQDKRAICPDCRPAVAGSMAILH